VPMAMIRTILLSGRVGQVFMRFRKKKHRDCQQ